jgi:hypothetical protein
MRPPSTENFRVALTSPDALDDVELDLGSIDIADLAAEPAGGTLQPRGMVERTAQVKLGRAGQYRCYRVPWPAARLTGAR